VFSGRADEDRAAASSLRQDKTIAARFREHVARNALANVIETAVGMPA
jgi:hypothetical protein